MIKFSITILLLSGIVVLGVFYLKPEWQMFQNLRTENEDLQQTSEEFDGLIQSRDTLIETINVISAEHRKLIDQALPRGPAGADLLVSLEGLSKQNGLALKRADLTSTITTKQIAGGQPKTSGQPTVQPTTISEFPINLNLTGPYTSFKRFLENVEKNIRLLEVENITFITPSKGDVFDFNLRLKTYYQ